MSQTAEKVLELKNLKTEFITKDSRLTAVNGVSFHINKGEILGLVGESGCGKSVTSLSIMRLFRDTPGKITEGAVYYKGENITDISEREMAVIRGQDISMIFQEPLTSLNPVMRIGDQLVETILKHTSKTKHEAMEIAKEMLRKVGIPRADEIVREYPHQLSGGMNQRVMIAMAMSLNPQVLIADEPTTALDVTIQAQILELMRQINKDHGMSILLITHDLGVVAEMCQRVVVMYAGRIVEEAEVVKLFKSPLHPYTKGLINSVPVLGRRVERLESIPGNVPTLSKMPSGCKFAPRCLKKMDICVEKEPPIFNIDEGGEIRKCRCWLMKDLENSKEGEA
ncbi:MAG: ABC transporter ATP-binding protein [Lachnospiraceae bacterium]|jgi:peptide/nickel transport system ATP-binding protein|nr:ABC transporter ATP-binding protein [Lachnospiraceae bacterium]